MCRIDFNAGLRGLASVALFWLFALWQTANAHPYHQSVTEIEWNATAHHWELAIRILPEDLENALQPLHGERVDLQHTTAVDELILRYLQSHIRFRAIDQTPTPADVGDIRWSWIGKQVDYKAAWLYVEVNAPPPPVQLSNTLLFERQPEQINRVFHLIKGRRQALDYIAARGPQWHTLALMHAQ